MTGTLDVVDRHFDHIQHRVLALIQVLNALVILRRGLAFAERRAAGVLVEVVGQEFGQRVLFGARSREGGVALVGQHVFQVDAVGEVGEGGVEHVEGIAVAAAGQEVQRHDADRLRGVVDQFAVLHQGDEAAVGLLQGHRFDALARRGDQGVEQVVLAGEGGFVDHQRAVQHLGLAVGIEAEAQTAHLPELAGGGAGCGGGHGMFQHHDQLFRRQRLQRQAVVEAQGVGDVQLGHVAGVLARRRVGFRRNLHERAVGGLAGETDVVADAAAVLDRHQHGVVELARGGQVGIGGQVAQVGLLGAHLGAGAVQEHVGLAEDLAVLFGDHAGHGVDQFPDGLLRGALAESGVQRIAIVDVEQVAHAVVGGGKRAGDVLVDALGNDVAVFIELDDQAADILVGAVGGHDGHRIAVGIGAEEGVAVHVRRIARLQATVDILVVGHDGVRTAGDDHVDPAQQAGQLLLDGELLQVADQDDLVDALVVDQTVDLHLDQVGQVLQVALPQHAHGAGRGQAFQQRRRRAHHADALAALLDDGGRGDLVGRGVEGRRLGRVGRIDTGVDQVGDEVGGGAEVIGEQVADIVRAVEVQVGRQIGEQRPRPVHLLQEVLMAREGVQDRLFAGAGQAVVLLGVELDDVLDDVGAQVELVVAQSGGIEADQVHDRDVDPAGKIVDFVEEVRVAVAVDVGDEDVCRRQPAGVLDRVQQEGVDLAQVEEAVGVGVRTGRDLRHIDQGGGHAVTVDVEEGEGVVQPFEQRVEHRGLAGGVEERAGQIVVASRQRDRSDALGFRIRLQRGFDGREVGCQADGVDAAFQVGCMENLQGEGHGCYLRLGQGYCAADLVRRGRQRLTCWTVLRCH